MSKALLVLSGGQDSTACGFYAKELGIELHAITFDYNQKHKAEIDAAKKIASLLEVASHEIITLGPVLDGTSPLTNPDEELEQYDSYDALPGGLEKTFVPGRNLLFLTIAANRAYCKGIRRVITGVCQEDSGGYPDCRRSFIDALEATLAAGLFTGEEGALEPVTIETPLMNLTKAESVRFALTLPGCYEALAYSMTSYDGAYPPLGNDHATLLRAKGFAEANVPDPLILRAAMEDLMKLPESTGYQGDMTKWLEKANLI